MLNHSCDPSLEMIRAGDEPNPGVLFNACKPIAAEEEMTISYLENSRSMERKTRQEELMYKYGFQCDCTLCKAQART